jgi:hypothetical protein
MTAGVAFYCMSSEMYFPGAVGLVNSLRLVGHTEPIYLLDCGLSPEHRDLLAQEAAVVPGSPETPPYLLKTIAPLRHPAEVMVLIDADMVVTRPLTPLIEQAAAGRVVAVKDNLDRFVPEWGELLDLGPVRRRPYVTSALVLLGGEVGRQTLELWDDRLDRVEYEPSWFASEVPDYPFLFLEQDVLNAILGARLEPESTVTVDARLAPIPPFNRLRLVDEATLRCEHADGTEPYVIHQFVRKPWLEPMYHGIYSRLLTRLWLGDDVALRLPEREVPRRMRRGPIAHLERRAVDAFDLARWYLRDVIPERIRARRAAARGEARSGP